MTHGLSFPVSNMGTREPVQRKWGDSQGSAWHGVSPQDRLGRSLPPSGLTPNNPTSRSPPPPRPGWESDPCLQYRFISNLARELFRGEVINQEAGASIPVVTTEGRKEASKS